MSAPAPSAARRAVALVACPLALLIPAGCQQVTAGSGGDSAGTGSRGDAVRGGPAAVTVTITDAGCRAEPRRVPAGPATFTVTNDDAARVTEAELVNADGRILGEKENLTTGLSGTFSLDLEPGRYSLYCPGADTETVAFTVSGGGGGGRADTVPAGRSDVSKRLADGVAGYRDYVRAQTGRLVAATRRFTSAVRDGDLPRAKRLYGRARVFYERIEPVAESFGDLDPAIDARAGDVAEPSAWTGFHPLERALWQRGSTAGTRQLADGLDADVERLDRRVQRLAYQPADLANGATALLEEVAKSKITGEEERYSHLDLLDIAANVDGARRAFELLAPALREIDPGLVRTIAARFDAVDQPLARYRDGGSFVSYQTLSRAQVKALSDRVDALGEPLSRVAARIVSRR